MGAEKVKGKLSFRTATQFTVFLVLIEIVILFRSCILRDRIEQIPFERSSWQQATSIGNSRTVRSQMIDNLMNQFDFEGWTVEQVVELLGPPNENPSGFGQWDLVDVLGLERHGGLSLDDEALGFKMNSDGVVKVYGLSVN